MNFNWNRALDNKMELARRAQGVSEFDADTKRIAALRGNGGGGGGADALAHQQAIGLKAQQDQAFNAQYGHAAMNAAHTANVAGRGLGGGITRSGNTFTGSSPLPQSGGVGQTTSLGLQPLQTSLPGLGSSFEEQTQPYGAFRGENVVRSNRPEAGPTNDTELRKVAKGETILNAEARKIIGPKKIAEANAKGAARMGLGLRGGMPEMKDGVLHAVRGENLVDGLKVRHLGGNAADAAFDKYFKNAPISPQEIRAGMANRKTTQHLLDAADDTMRRADDIYNYKSAQVAPEAATTAKPTPGMAGSARGTHPEFERMRPRTNLQQGLESIKNLRAAPRSGLSKAIGAVAKSPATQVALSPLWAMTGGRERAEEGSGVASTDLYGSTRGAAISGAREVAKDFQEGSYGKAALGVPMTALETLAGFADDSIVKPLAHVGQAMWPGKPGKGLGQRPAATQQPAATGVAGLGTPDAQVLNTQFAGPEAQAAQADEAGYSQFFNERGITDEMRANPQKGLREINVGAGNKVYRRGNEYVGMGAPSRIAAETARANDPAVKKEAYMKQLSDAAMAGNKEAGSVLQQIIQADAQVAAEGLRAQATLGAAREKGDGKKGSGDGNALGLNEMVKAASVILGEGREGELFHAVNQSKQADILKLKQKAAATQDPAKKQELLDAADAASGADPDLDYMHEVAKRMRLREVAAAESGGNRALNFGAWGTPIIGGLAGAATYGVTKNKGLAAKAAGAFGLTGGAGSAAYGYKSGTHGIDEYTDLSRLSNDVTGVQGKNGDLLGEGTVIPGNLLPEDVKIAYGLRR